MPHTEKQHVESAPPIDLDRKASPSPQPPSNDSKRFDIFLVDTGWNVPISKLVRSHLPLLYEYQSQESLYLLTHEQSVEILKRAPEFIGHDPTVLVYDLRACWPQASQLSRFSSEPGPIQAPGTVLARLQEFIRFLVAHRSSVALDTEVRRELHREGAKGMIKILREASTELL